MGQQQLLLLVLGIVIVGLAVVAGLQAFSVNQKKANADALLVTAMRIATDLQAWLQTPEAFGGGRPATGGVPGVDFVTVSLVDLGYPVNGSGEYVTIDGTFTMIQDGDGIFIGGFSPSSSGAGDNNVVCLEVNGHLLNDISTSVSSGPATCD